MVTLEFLTILFILWLVYRRLIKPFIEGYRQIRGRFDDLNRETSNPLPRTQPKEPKIDRSQVKDADFRDLR